MQPASSSSLPEPLNVPDMVHPDMQHTYGNDNSNSSSPITTVMIVEDEVSEFALPVPVCDA